MKQKCNHLIILCTILLLPLLSACQQCDKGATEGVAPAVEQTTVDRSAGNLTAEEQSVIASSTDAIVVTDYGKVRGYIHTGTYTYKGIPYAKAERFMPPEEPDSDDAPFRSALSFGPISPQDTSERDRYGDELSFILAKLPQIQGEDCQRLNIWTPGIHDGGSRPVMVWLHGGGFSSGSGHEMADYDGENLSEKGDLVVVTLNHRLNILGFLDLSAYGEKYKYSGNVGMMDIVAALGWVKNNITNFGGDPGNVTIFGQSGGGGKVSTLLATPAAKGLFHKAIVQSGSTLKVGETAIARKVGIAVMEELGLKSDQADMLQTIPYDDLRKAGEKALRKVGEEMEADPNVAGLRFGWAPVMDVDYLPTHPFFRAAPEISKDIPLMVGSTGTEFFPSMMNPALRNATMDQAKEFLSKMYGDKTEAFIAAFGSAYPGYQPVDLIDTDIRSRANAVTQARLKASLNAAPVYVYLFRWKSPILDGIFKSVHCIEIPFAFNNVTRCEQITGGGPKAYALSDKVSQAWINFARTGNPNNEKLPIWPAFDDENGPTMIFDDACVVKNNHDKELLGVVAGK